MCGLCIRSVPGRLGERHGAVCREISNLLQPRYSSAVSPPPLLLRMEKKNDKNTWRCPDQSADSPASYWLRAPVCHCRPSKAKHHLLRACCDENKGRRGRRGGGAWGEWGWGGGGGCVGGEMGGGTWHYCWKKALLWAFPSIPKPWGPYIIPVTKTAQRELHTSVTYKYFIFKKIISLL